MRALRAALALVLLAGCGGKESPAQSAAPAAPKESPPAKSPDPVAVEGAPAKPGDAPAPAPSSPESPADPAPAAGAATGAKFVKLNDAEIKSLVEPALKPDEVLAHAVFQGNLGPDPKAILALYNRTGGITERFGGFALIPSGGGFSRLELPAFKDQWAEYEITAVILDNLDADEAIEPVIMASYMTGVGPDGAKPLYNNIVVDWDGRSFVRLPAIEEKIDNVGTAKEIRKILASAPAPAALPAAAPKPLKSLSHGASAWAVYPYAGEPGPKMEEALKTLNSLGITYGFSAGQISCDQGAAEALKVDPAASAVGVYFASKADAEAFAKLLPKPAAGIAKIKIACAD
jgi:hypothetical protein